MGSEVKSGGSKRTVTTVSYIFRSIARDSAVGPNFADTILQMAVRLGNGLYGSNSSLLLISSDGDYDIHS